MEMSISLRILLSHMASHAATAAPLYFASVLDNVIVGCILLLQEIALLLKEKTNPDVYPSSRIHVADL